MASLKETDSGFLVAGNLDVDNVMILCEQGDKYIADYASKKKSFCAIDLGDLKESNAVVLALLLAWLRSAKRCQMSVSFTNLSDAILRMIKAFGLKDILPVQ